MARTYGLCVCSPAGVPLITFTIRRSILTPQNRNSFILLYFSSSSFVPAGCGEWCECISAWTVLLFVRLDVCFSHAVRRTIDDGAPSIHFVHFYFISFSIERRREREKAPRSIVLCVRVRRLTKQIYFSSFIFPRSILISIVFAVARQSTLNKFLTCTQCSRGLLDGTHANPCHASNMCAAWACWFRAAFLLFAIFYVDLFLFLFSFPFRGFVVFHGAHSRKVTRSIEPKEHSNHTKEWTAKINSN